MILLDTNLLSEPLKPQPEPRVQAWLDAQVLETLYLPAIVVAELRAGVSLLPEGKRKAHLHQQLETRVFPLFAGRILPFDLSCTQAYAAIIQKTRRQGSGISTADACIAAIAQAQGFIVATRDTRPFLAAGLEVINPWKATD